ncbi:hypothetical protein [Luethyella okanaganae]|uniref:Uncharacterized protein n=1 Tax=Luethyella okanaganae TaxID=69372 RepID=A0ABW1VJ05_9MICO
MQVIETVHAEPREVLERPSYRVNFWEKSGQAWALDAYALFDVQDITEVLQWIEGRSSGRQFELFVEMNDEVPGAFQDPRTSGLIHLMGTNPNAGNISVF